LKSTRWRYYTVAAPFIAALYWQARRQARAKERQLESGSRLIPTRYGVVEYASAGEGLPVLVSHGSFGGYDQGLEIGMPLLQAGCRLIAPSRPGYLRTPLTSGRTPAAQADLLAALLDELGVERAAVPDFIEQIKTKGIRSLPLET
jgi:pimeloyl-ACP methyl ester carboxylesterase